MKLLKIIFVSLVIAACKVDTMRGQIAGGISVIKDQAHHNEVVGLLKDNIDKLESGKWEIIDVEKTAQQVVAGMNYFIYGTFKNNDEDSIYKATMRIYTRPWENFMEITVHEKYKIL